MPGHILLLKNADETSPSDPYQHALSSHGLSSTIIPTLSHSYTDPDRLADIIVQGGSELYGGAIVTSGRAVDAWANALRAAAARQVAANAQRSWKTVPFYVVGPRTEKQLLDLGNSTLNPDWLPASNLVLGAKESGTGEALAKFIRTDYPSRPGHKLPLLYLTGDKNAGGVGAGLEGSGIEVQMVQVYATSPSSTFEDEFEKSVEGKGSELVVVFFAPSSAELALPVIRKHFTLRSSSNAQVDEGKPMIRVAAIGPTTARALTENHTIQVDAVSNKPDPEALTEAILSLWST